MQAAALTAPGAGGIAVIALQGSDLTTLLNRVFKPISQTPANTPHLTDLAASWSRLHLGHIYDHEETIDEVLVALDSKECSAEIHCHGGPRIVQRILMLLQRQGMDILAWPDFLTRQSLAQEVDYALCHALTPLAVEAIAAQMGPGMAHWIERAQGLLSQPDGLAQVKTQAAHLLQTYLSGRRLLEPATVVLAGPANVGKSTMINALAGREVSITANLPGTTRDWTSDLVAINGIAVHLIDTAGMGPTGDPLAADAAAQTAAQLERADLVVAVLDATAALAPQHIALTSRRQNCPTLLVANKVDLLSQPICADGFVRLIQTSAHDGTGLDQLRGAILDALGMGQVDPVAALLFTQRQYEWVEQLCNTDSQERAHKFLSRLNTPSSSM